jgi:hypothetical protein
MTNQTAIVKSYTLELLAFRRKAVGVKYINSIFHIFGEPPQTAVSKALPLFRFLSGVILIVFALVRSQARDSDQANQPV